MSKRPTNVDSASCSDFQVQQAKPKRLASAALSVASPAPAVPAMTQKCPLLKFPLQIGKVYFYATSKEVTSVVVTEATHVARQTSMVRYVFEVVSKPGVLISMVESVAKQYIFSTVCSASNQVNSDDAKFVHDAVNYNVGDTVFIVREKHETYAGPSVKSVVPYMVVSKRDCFDMYDRNYAADPINPSTDSIRDTVPFVFQGKTKTVFKSKELALIVAGNM